MSHAVNIYDGDAMLLDFQNSVSVDLRRLELHGMMPRAVALREDLWPEVASVHGYPVVRLARSSGVPWAVLV